MFFDILDFPVVFFEWMLLRVYSTLEHHNLIVLWIGTQGAGSDETRTKRDWNAWKTAEFVIVHEKWSARGWTFFNKICHAFVACLPSKWLPLDSHDDIDVLFLKHYSRWIRWGGIQREQAKLDERSPYRHVCPWSESLTRSQKGRWSMFFLFCLSSSRSFRGALPQRDQVSCWCHCYCSALTRHEYL
jgi:hypothetical protein